MMPTSGKRILAALLCVLALASCGDWHGAKDVSTDVGGDALGSGPGLFTGKQGGIVIYSAPWTGAAPGGDEAD